MRHPLENPSLGDYTVAFTSSLKRRGYESKDDAGYVNPERVIMRVWHKVNTAHAGRPLPVRTIIHEIMPGVARANLITKGNFVFEGDPYWTHDLMVLSAVVQWLATNVGSRFFSESISSRPNFHPEREFVMKFADMDVWRQRQMLAMWVHECTDKCYTGSSLDPDYPHHLSLQLVMPRDRALIDGFMRWLGRKEGREFMVSYRAKFERARKVRREQLRKEKAAQIAA